MASRLTLAAGCAVALMLMGAVQARAAAWTEAQGQGQVIGDVYHTDSQKGFDPNGHVTGINGYHKTEVTVYGDYGITPKLTGFVQTGLERVTIDNQDATQGLGYSEIGGRYKLTSLDAGALSIQASVRLPGSSRVNGPAQVGNTDTQEDLRVLYGQAFKVAGKDAFIDLEGGYRFRNGAPPNEYHLDATVGLRPTAKLLLLAQMFGTISDGAGTGVFTKYRYYNAQVGAAYDITPHWTVQAAWVGTVYGQNALQERGFNIGLWHKY
jgi:hypothetical protein